MWLKLAPYIGLLIALAGFYFWADNHGYDRATSFCATDTVPKAQKAEQKICADNNLITEKANDKNLRDKNIADARYSAAMHELRKRPAYCMPVTDASNILNAGTSGLQVSGARGVDGGDILKLGRDAQIRSDEYTACRAFVLDVWKKNPNQ